MEQQDWHETGIYIAWPTSPIWKPIYPDAKTEVNDSCTNIGVPRCRSFESRKADYVSDFGGEVEFEPLASTDDLVGLRAVEKDIHHTLLREGFRRVGRAPKWFQTDDRDRVKEIVQEVLLASGIEHRWLD